jgi:hypothetical protein
MFAPGAIECGEQAQAFPLGQAIARILTRCSIAANGLLAKGPF